MAFPDAWTQKCKISISKEGGSDITFGARTQDININEGNKQGHSEASVSGARLWIEEPQEDGTIELKMRSVSLDTTKSEGGLIQWFYGGTWDTTDPLETDDSLDRDKFRVAVLWTNDPENSGAHLAVTAGKEGLRFSVVEARIVSFSASFSNKDLVFSTTFKFAPRDADGDINTDWASCTTASMTALGDYT